MIAYCKSFSLETFFQQEFVQDFVHYAELVVVPYRSPFHYISMEFFSSV